jgi:hypothetical protein
MTATLTLNAFVDDGDGVSGALGPKAYEWGGQGAMLAPAAPLAPPDAVDMSDWRHPDVGWGIVLPDRDDVSPADKARGADAPAPIRDLLDARPDAPVLRYRPEPELDVHKLRRYLPGGEVRDPEVALSTFGVAKDRLPLYVLIVGSPAEVPWRLQYSLARRHHVGRLDLPDEALATYVRALKDDWSTAPTEPTRPVVWSAHFDSMTAKMEATIAARVRTALGADAEIPGGGVTLQGSGATHSALRDALAQARPSVILTSSHGRTGPLDDPEEMRRTLGLPVDNDRQVLDVDQLLQAWSPGGAIWWAMACCSAGCERGTAYEGLLAEGTLAYRVVHAVGELGPIVSQLPTRLLSADPPLRAFVGHVEPTFDWTLLANGTGQFLTAPLITAVYPNLYRRWPVGRTLEEYHAGVGILYGKLKDARDAINAMVDGARDLAIYYKLTAGDRESLVILGDPTAAIPPLPSQAAP